MPKASKNNTKAKVISKKIKYNWIFLKEEFIKSDFIEAKAFLRSKNIPTTSYYQEQCKGWTKEKKDYQGIIQGLAQEKSIEHQAETLAQKSARRLKFYDNVRLNHIEKAISDLKLSDKQYQYKLRELMNLYVLVAHEERLEDGQPNTIAKSENNSQISIQDDIISNEETLNILKKYESETIDTPLSSKKRTKQTKDKTT